MYFATLLMRVNFLVVCPQGVLVCSIAPSAATGQRKLYSKNNEGKLQVRIVCNVKPATSHRSQGSITEQ